MGQALYHDGACTCATLANLTQRVGLPGRGKIALRSAHELINSRFAWQSFNLFTDLKGGWVFLARTRILSGFQFTTHFIEIFVVETICFCTRDLDAANLRPALEQGCGKQTSSARKLFFRANLLYVPSVKM